MAEEQKLNDEGWHTHVDEHGNVIRHTHHQHSHEHGPHGHTHSHAHTKAVLNRMSKLIGHLESIRTMIENGRDCSDVLIQIAAVNVALNKVGKLILKDHMEHCIVDAIRENDEEAIRKLVDAIVMFIK